MTIEQALRLLAGVFILMSLLLSVYISPNFLWFTAFVGANLLLSGFINWCPMMSILRKAGLKHV